VEVAEASGEAFAATWRNEQGAIVGKTFGGTMCLWPVKPWRIRFHKDGFEGVMRCRECPGCLEFDRRRMADRLQTKYGLMKPCHGAGRRGRAPVGAAQPPSRSSCLFVVRIWAPRDQPDPLGIVKKPAGKKRPTQWADNHSRLANKLHRRRGLELEPGMWRLGAGSFALISRSRDPLPALLKRLGLRHRIEPLRLSRGRRAWRVLTAGLLVAREIYGEQRNRWYARGLPAADRQKWEVLKIGKYQSYDRARSPRAWTGRKLLLVPPEVWQLRRTDRLALRGQLLRASDPEGVQRVMRLVADAIRNAKSRFDVSAAPKALLSREAVVRQYQQAAERSRARTDALTADSSITPTSEVGGYVSSEHNQGELMPLELARARRKDWEEARKRKAIKDSMEIIERMKRKAPRGE
jgi:hypothetical protein